MTADYESIYGHERTLGDRITEALIFIEVLIIFGLVLFLAAHEVFSS